MRGPEEKKRKLLYPLHSGYPSEAASWDFRQKDGAIVSSGEILKFGRFLGWGILGAIFIVAGGKGITKESSDPLSRPHPYSVNSHLPHPSNYSDKQ